MLNECKCSVVIPKYYQRNLLNLMVFSLHSPQEAFYNIIIAASYDMSNDGYDLMHETADESINTNFALNSTGI